MSGITTCGACAFYFSRGQHEGVCRRNPPSSGNTGFQPPVRPTGGCGQGCAKYSERAIPPENGAALPTSPVARVGYVAEIAALQAEVTGLRAQVDQMEQERSDLLRRSDAARHAHEDLTRALNRTIQDCRDQNAGQCQEIVARNLQLERLQEKWDKKEKECREWARQTSDMGADITNCHRKIADLLRERGEQASLLEERDNLYVALQRREKEYADLAAMHRADCERRAKAHPEDKTPEDLYTTLVLCPVCGSELDRITHPKEELHAQGVAMIAGDERQEHRKASPACAQDARWIKGWILVPLGKPEAKP